MKNDIESLKISRDLLLNDFSDYKMLRKRNRRVLILIVGNELHYIFGTVTDTYIKRHILTLSNRQQSNVHVLEENISVLNTSRHNVLEN